MNSNWRFAHIGMVVADLEKTMAYLKSLGIFDIPDQPPDVLVGKNPETGASDGSLLKLDILLNGLGIEVIQPVSGKNLQRKFLDEHGEGVNHVCFEVPDIDSARKELEQKGVPVYCHIREKTSYYNSGARGNMLLEIRET
jgi:catechol 2,3-dioxygenase-like lactoylglutathione lyase family enzyme